MPGSFDYTKAFDRNLGWLSNREQNKLRESCVAIAGVGGAGGFQAQCLARLGIGRFKIADPDFFELSNINRQIGAGSSSLGQAKVSVIQKMILDINPHAEVEVFPEGIHENNIETFLNGCDLVIDGIDFFALEVKLLLFEKSRLMGVTAMTSCPVGFGASLILFSPAGMSFKDYIDIDASSSERDKRFSLAFALSPSALCLRYMKPEAGTLERNRAASVCPGLMLVGALTATETVKYLTGTGKNFFAPYVYQTDLFTQKTVRRYYPGGMKNPFLKLKKWLILQFFLPPEQKGAVKKNAPQDGIPHAA